jgi:hypothetical protein
MQRVDAERRLAALDAREVRGIDSSLLGDAA